MGTKKICCSDHLKGLSHEISRARDRIISTVFHVQIIEPISFRGKMTRLKIL
jgi:hypothetical protein